MNLETEGKISQAVLNFLKHYYFRSSHLKKGVIRNFAKFTGKHMCQRFFFNKVAGQACNFIKKETLVQVLSCEFCEIFKNTFFTEQLRTTASPNGHIFVDSPSIRRRNSTWKVRGNYIDFERRIHVEIMTSIRLGYFDVDSTFKIDEISMSSPRGFFYVVSESNRRNFCPRYFHSIFF